VVTEPTQPDRTVVAGGVGRCGEASGADRGPRTAGRLPALNSGVWGDDESAGYVGQGPSFQDVPGTPVPHRAIPCCALCTPSNWTPSFGGNRIEYFQSECADRNKAENPLHVRCRKRDSDGAGDEANAAEAPCHDLVHLAERASPHNHVAFTPQLLKGLKVEFILGLSHEPNW
jgi:hypothetical protein